MNRWRMLFALVSVVGLLAFPAGQGLAGGGQSDPASGSYAPETILVKFAAAAPEREQAALLQAHGLSVRSRIYGTDVLVLHAPGKQVPALVQALQQNPLVEYAEPDYKATAFWTPNDPGYGSQWALPKISAPQAWDSTRGSSSVMVAVVDTGVDPNHPDLVGKVRTDIDWDFVNNDDNAMDDNGHGTAVAALIAAGTNNGVGIAGMCPNCQILPVKVLDAAGSGTYSNIASGIRYAADNGAKVINLSLGGASGSTTLSDAITYADLKGALLSCTAGGSNSSTPSYPAYYSACLASTATDQSDNKASFASYGSWVDTSAPGVSIYTAYLNGTYTTLSGTSFSTAYVSGLAGLLFSQGRTKSDVRTRLTSSTYTDPVNSTLIPRRINAFKAVSP